jgi:hypothetical protein
VAAVSIYLEGPQYTADGLRARFGRRLADTEEGRELCRRWKEWVAAQVKKYEWDIEPGRPDRQRYRDASPECRALYAVPGPDEGCCGRSKTSPPCQRRGLDRERRGGYISAAKALIWKTPRRSWKTSGQIADNSATSMGNGVTVAYRTLGYLVDLIQPVSQPYPFLIRLFPGTPDTFARRHPRLKALCVCGFQIHPEDLAKDHQRVTMRVLSIG